MLTLAGAGCSSGIPTWGHGLARIKAGVAENAIRLYKAGDPCDVLQTQEGLSLAQFYQRFPFGLQVFHLVRPLGKTAYVAVMIFFVLIVAIPASWLWRIVRQRNRPATTPM